jgi:Ran-binding protein 3
MTRNTRQQAKSEASEAMASKQEKQENGSGSDNDSGEKPVREKLQKATIAAEKSSAETDQVKGAVSATSTNQSEDSEQTAESSIGTAGRLEKKRSHEDMDEGVVEEENTTQHTRKRSRDGRAEEADSTGAKRRVAEEASADKEDPASEAQLSDLEHNVSAGDSTGEKTKDAGPSEDKQHVGNENLQSEHAKGASLKRPGTPETKLEADPEAAIKSITSPKTKRSRHDESSITDNGVNGDGANAQLPGDDGAGKAGIAKDATSTALPSKDAQTASALPAKSGFGNMSSASPFGALAGSKSSTESKTNPSDSFQQSGFASLAGKPMSGFGSLGASSSGLGSFASGAIDSKAGDKEDAKPLSTFGGALGQKSVFGAASAGGGSVFGSGSSKGGFGSGFGGTGFGSLASAPGGLSSFASGRPAAASASKAKPAKPFGAPADDDDDDDDNENDDDDETEGKEGLLTGSEEPDPRFFAQESVTGEEEEKTEFNNRAKLYFFGLHDGVKQWRERGSGVLRLNIKKSSPDEPDAQPQARLIMRADGSHRVVLNTIVKKELKFGDPQGGPPQGGSLLFMGTIPGVEDGAGKLELLQIRVGRAKLIE